MRREPTPFENAVWQRLRASQLGGFKFRRQTVIGSFICDFFCPAKGLIIEIDGDTHDLERRTGTGTESWLARVLKCSDSRMLT